MNKSTLLLAGAALATTLPLAALAPAKEPVKIALASTPAVQR